MKKSEPTYAGHRARVKEKFRREGISGWHEYEVLELLLFHAIPRSDTKPAAKALIEKFKTVNGVLSADIERLKEVPGISSSAACFLKLIEDVSVLCRREEMVEKELLNSPGLVFEYLKSSLRNAPDEKFKVLFLNTRNRLIASETLHEGTVNRSVVYPRKVVERALYNKSASIIISHNHPAGSLDPSPDDIEATRSIRKALETVEVNLLDHVIIGGGAYFSFAENGINF